MEDSEKADCVAQNQFELGIAIEVFGDETLKNAYWSGNCPRDSCTWQSPKNCFDVMNLEVFTGDRAAEVGGPRTFRNLNLSWPTGTKLSAYTTQDGKPVVMLDFANATFNVD